MKCGRLYLSDGGNAGFGQSCVVGHAKSLRMRSEIEAKRPVNFCGSGFRQVTKVVKVSAICGKPTNWSFRQIPINASEKAKGRLITWNAGITDLGNPMLVLFARPCPSPNQTLCMKSLHAHLLSNIISHLLVNHYQRVTVPVRHDDL